MRGRQRAGIAASATWSATSSLREAAGDAPLVVDLPSECVATVSTRLSRMIASSRPMFSPVSLPNLRGAVAGQREADGRPVVLVERRPRAAQVLAGDRRQLAAPGRTCVPASPPPAGAGDHFHVVAAACRRAACEQRLARRRRTGFDDLELSCAVERMISLARATSVDAGQLDQDLVAGVAVRARCSARRRRAR